MKNIKNKKTEIREIVYCQDDEKSFGDIFVYEPENVDEQKLGSLFIVGELRDLPRNCSYIINLLASKIKKEFYSNTKRTSEESLEAGLMEANAVLADLARQGNGEYIGKLNMVCGTYKHRKFYISQIGKIKSLLVRDKKISEIIKEADMPAFSPERVFNNIASGELVENDVVIFGTPGLFNIFSLEKIKKLSAVDIDEFANKLQDKIEEEGEELVSALIIKIDGDKGKELVDYTEMQQVEGAEIESPVLSLEENIEEISPIEPVEEIGVGTLAIAEDIKTEIESENTSIPVLAKEKKQSNKEDIKKISLSDIIKEYERMEGKSEQTEERDKNMSAMMSKKEDNDFMDLDEKEPNTVSKMTGKIRDKARTADVKGKFMNLFKKEEGKEEFPLEKEVRSLNLMPNKKLIMLAVAVVIIVASSYFQSIKKKEAAATELKNYENILSQSKDKMDQAEIEMISDSSKNAGELFLEARNLAQKVKDEYNGLDDKAEDIIVKAQTEIDKIDLVKKVESPEILANFEDKDTQKIVEIGNVQYVINNVEKSVYKIDQGTKQLEKLAQLDGSLGNIIAVKNFQNQEILISDGSKIANFNPKNNQSGILEETSEIENFNNLTTYSKYVYFLSPNQNQIYKMQKNGQKLESKTEWLKSGNIQDAVSLTIDQYIYVLNSKGEVKKYFIGAEYVDSNNKKFTLVQPSDPVTNPTQIVTIPEKKYIFITEPSKNRVLIFDKQTGALIKQLTGQDFIGIQDISIDSEEKNITIITDTKVFRTTVN
jgi:hypothetical protein